MPIYEYFCRTCSAKFELLQPASAANDPAVCPRGHRGAERLISVFSAVTRDASGAPVMPAGGGCACGGGACGCGH